MPFSGKTQKPPCVRLANLLKTMNIRIITALAVDVGSTSQKSTHQLIEASIGWWRSTQAICAILLEGIEARA